MPCLNNIRHRFILKIAALCLLLGTISILDSSAAIPWSHNFGDGTEDFNATMLFDVDEDGVSDILVRLDANTLVFYDADGLVKRQFSIPAGWDYFVGPLNHIAPSFGAAPVFSDVDGDNVPEMVISVSKEVLTVRTGRLLFYNTQTGALKWQSDDIPDFDGSDVLVGNVDGDEQEELIYTTSLMNIPSMEVVSSVVCIDGASKNVQWSKQAVSSLTELFRVTLKPTLVDVNNDGVMEVAISRIYGDRIQFINGGDGSVNSEIVPGAWVIGEKPKGIFYSGSDLNVFSDIDGGGDREILVVITTVTISGEDYFSDSRIQLYNAATKALKWQSDPIRNLSYAEDVVLSFNMDADSQHEIIYQTINGTPPNYTSVVTCIDGNSKTQQWSLNFDDGMFIWPQDIDNDGTNDVYIAKTTKIAQHDFYNGSNGSLKLRVTPTKPSADWELSRFIGNMIGMTSGPEVYGTSDMDGDGVAELLLTVSSVTWSGEVQTGAVGRIQLYSSLTGALEWETGNISWGGPDGANYGNFIMHSGNIDADVPKELSYWTYTQNGDDNVFSRTLHVIDGPDNSGGATPAISRTPATMTFTGQEGGANPAAQTLSISNSGGGTLTWSVSDNAAWLALSPASGSSTGETDSVSVSADTTGLAVGTYNATITITAAVATNTPLTVAVTLTVTAVAAPTIAFTPATMDFSAQEGGASPAGQTLSISNSGSGMLSWSVSDTAAWLTLAPASGSATSETDAVTVSVSPAGLAAGTYNATITITAADATNNPRTVAVTFTVESLTDPQIAFTPYSLSFAAQAGGANPAGQTLGISNSGVGTLNWSVSDNAGWLTLNPGSGSATSETDNVTVSVSISGLAAGTYTGSITVTAAAAVNSPRTVPVTLVVSPPPVIAVSPASLAFSGQQGGASPASQTLGVYNSGGGTLNWSVTDDAAWLSLTPASGSSTGETDNVTVSVNSSGLAVGVYTANISVTSAEASNSPRTIGVTLTISEIQPPAISRSPASMSFSGRQLAASPDAQSLSILNSGGGTLSWTVSDNATWLSLSPASGSSTGETDAVTVSVNTAGLTAGVYPAVITISDISASNTPQTTSVTLTVTPFWVLNPGEESVASVSGGAKGFVNLSKGESLTIGFTPSGSGAVTVKVYDTAGRLVRELGTVANASAAGSLSWDGRDSSGNKVSSGVYVIRIKGPGIDVNRRTVIVK